MTSMKMGIEGIYQISVAIRTFSRADTCIKVLFDIHEGLESTLLILRHRLKAIGDRNTHKVTIGEVAIDFAVPSPIPHQTTNIFRHLQKFLWGRQDACPTRTFGADVYCRS